MIRVGNDVVDLDEPAIAHSHQKEKFLARVCAPSERALIAAAADPKVLLWSLFAAKEAAFKVVSKLGPRPVFAHRQFVVAADLRSVQYLERVLSLWIDVAPSHVHAVCSTEAQRPRSAVGPAGADPGAAVRALVLELVGLEGAEVIRDLVEGSWDGFGPPRLVHRGAVVARDLSLSHDGRFVACCATSSTSP